MKKILSLLAFTLLFSNIFADKGVKIKFNKNSHDFGMITETNGNATTVFEFTNTGVKPLIIRNVSSSCGCTTPEWTKKPVLPGQKGTIKAIYNPKNRPGSFNKSITVYSNAEKPRVKLTIKGVVKRKAPTMKQKFPIKLGSLRFTQNRFALTKIYKNKTKNASIEVHNPSNKAVTLEFKNVPEHVKFKLSSKVVKPGKNVTITCIYNSKKTNDWGYSRNYVYLKEKETGKQNLIYVEANIQEDFSKLTKKQLKDAPKVQPVEKIHDFGELKQGQVVKHKFMIKNAGKSPLKIRKVKAGCGCTAVNHSKKDVVPGDYAEIEVSFNTRGRKGKQYKSVSVVTNDPKKPRLTLTFKANIVVEGSN